jgi:hypothetical protein
MLWRDLPGSVHELPRRIGEDRGKFLPPGTLKQVIPNTIHLLPLEFALVQMRANCTVWVYLFTPIGYPYNKKVQLTAWKDDEAIL